MTGSGKVNIFFIQPLFYKPTLPNFKDRFEMLSERCRGNVVSSSDAGFDGLRFRDFTYHSLPYIRSRYLKHVYYVLMTVWIALRCNRKERIDYVHSYDPLTYGLAAVIIGLFTGARVIIEVNGDLLQDGFLDKKGLGAALKKLAFTLLIRTSFRYSSAIKVLNSSQLSGWRRETEGKRVFMFHDFVPTHVFDPARSSDGGYILLMGHPFYRKGVDILIKAFLKIADRFPEARLLVVGHASQEERGRYAAMSGGHPRVELRKPVFYDDAVELLQGCSFLVLPSRSEAMGRVLLEAMACGKAVVGSNTGGIPGIIEDNGNGFLVEPRDVDGLAERMAALLGDKALRERMGRRSLELVGERFSSARYAERFYEMLKA